jgi:hypothetical protein
MILKAAALFLKSLPLHYLGEGHGSLLVGQCTDVGLQIIGVAFEQLGHIEHNIFEMQQSSVLQPETTFLFLRNDEIQERRKRQGQGTGKP